MKCPDCGGEAKAYPPGSFWHRLAYCLDDTLKPGSDKLPCGRVFSPAPRGWEVAETSVPVSEMTGAQLRALREAREERDFADSPAGMVAGWIAEQREMGLWDGE